MPVVNVIQKWSAGQGEENDQADTLDAGYTVLLDSADNGISEALAAPGIPSRNDPIDANHPTHIVRRRRAIPISPLLIEVQVFARTPTPVNDPTGNPIFDPPVLRWSGITSVEPIEEDISGNPIVNSAGFRIDAAEEVHTPVLSITKNVSGLTPQIIVSYRGATNSDFFFALPGQAKIAELEAEPVTDGLVPYWRLNAQVHFREGRPFQSDDGYGQQKGGPARAWWKRILDEGYHELVQGTGQGDPIRIIDRYGTEIGEPMKLRPNGSAIRPPSADPAHWLEYQTRNSLPFSPLFQINIPTFPGT